MSKIDEISKMVQGLGLDASDLQSVEQAQAALGSGQVANIPGVTGVDGTALANLQMPGLQSINGRMALVQEMLDATGLNLDRWLSETQLSKLQPGQLQATNVTGAINQGAPESKNVQLGTGKSTIGRAGCFLGTLTEARNEFARRAGQPNTIGIIDANERVKAGGGFSGSNLLVSKATSSLDMSLRWREPANHRTLADAQQELRAGNLVFAGVDYKDGRSSSVSQADHFLLLTEAGDGTFKAKDPAGGRELTFIRDPKTGDYTCGKYRITELGALEPTERAAAIPNQFRRI